MMLQATGWRYWWRRYLGWMPFQTCMLCGRWFWGGFPTFDGWQACYQDYCSLKCHQESGE